MRLSFKSAQKPEAISSGFFMPDMIARRYLRHIRDYSHIISFLVASPLVILGGPGRNKPNPNPKPHKPTLEKKYENEN
jgi:hypothetical protein